MTDVALRDFLSRNLIPNFNYEAFLDGSEKPITLALAISGGGYRAMLTGGGVLTAYDSRTPNSNETGHLGGLLQALSYIGGISGGSWLVMSNLINDFRPIYELKDDSSTWELQQKLLEGVPNFDPSHMQDILRQEQSTDKTSFIDNIFNWFSFGKGNSSDNMDANRLQLKEDSLSSDIKKTITRSSVMNNFVKPFLFKETFANASEGHTPKGTSGVSWKEIFKFYKELNIEVRAKRSAGYYLSFTDYWGRVLARRIFPTSARAPGATVTASTFLPSFQRHEQPFPIIGAVEKAPTKVISSRDSHVFEFNPFEFGSWDSYLNAFVTLKYLGSSLIDGRSIYPTQNPNISICVSGFDNIGFITGTSSCMFSHIFVYVYHFLMGMKLDASLAVNTILTSFGLSSNFNSMDFPQHHPDYASFSPNPFFGYNRSQLVPGDISKSDHMYLVDGGDDGQNIPFQPFLQPARSVDVIFAFDMTSDIFNYPNGTSLIRSMERFHNNDSSLFLPNFHTTSPRPNNNCPLTKLAKGYNQTVLPELNDSIRAVFPYVPNSVTLLNLNLNNKPVFFGCDLINDYPELVMGVHPNNATITKYNSAEDQYLPPLIVYTANSNYSFASNTSTFQLSYTPEEVSGMIQNGYNLATNMNSTHYSICISCAIFKRQFDRKKLQVRDLEDFRIPPACQKCFDEFCWTKS